MAVKTEYEKGYDDALKAVGDHFAKAADASTATMKVCLKNKREALTEEGAAACEKAFTDALGEKIASMKALSEVMALEAAWRSSAVSA